MTRTNFRELLDQAFGDAAQFLRWVRKLEDHFTELESADVRLEQWIPHDETRLWALTDALAHRLHQIGLLQNEREVQRITDTLPVAPRQTSLEAYRQMIHGMFGLLPALFPGGDPRCLSDVYVELDIGVPDASAGEVGTDSPWFSAPTTGGRQRLDDLLDWDSPARIALIGPPGSGKTSLLLQLALRQLKKTDKRPPVVTPVMLRVAELLSTGLDATLNDQFGKDWGQMLSAEIKGGRALLLLDGMDEHPTFQRAQKDVARISVEAPRIPIIVTSRPVGYRRPTQEFDEFHLRGLTEEAQLELLVAWMGDEATRSSAIATLEEVRSRPRMRRMVENPLLLTFIGLVTQFGGSIPVHRTALYRQAVDCLLRGSHRAQTSELDIDVSRALLSRIGLNVHGREARETRTERIVEQLRSEARFPNDIRALLHEIARVSGLVVPVRSPHHPERYAFAHRTLQEFMAAMALARHLEECPLESLDNSALARVMSDEEPDVVFELPRKATDIEMALTKARRHPELWSELLALVFGQLDQEHADNLLRHVAQTGSKDLFSGVIGGADGISRELIFFTLRMPLRHDAWETRRDILKSLPTHCSSAELEMALVYRFGQSAEHGADLWWANHQLTELSKGLRKEYIVQRHLFQQAAARANEVWSNHRPSEASQVQHQLASLWQPVMADGHDRFYVLSHLVDNELFQKFDSKHGSDADRHSPVTNVTWYEADAFARWLGASLPSQKELQSAEDEGRLSRDTLSEWTRDALVSCADLSRSSSATPDPGERRVVVTATSKEGKGCEPGRRLSKAGFRLVRHDAPRR